jgi:predicted dehydrogenase
MINLGIMGVGYWGPNLVRDFTQLSEANILRVCDLKEENLSKIKNRYPQLKTTKNYLDLIQNQKIEALVISTPAVTHFKLTKEGLLNNKHIFCEKPLALSTKEGEELVRLSREKEKILMVGHLLKYHPAVRKLKEYVEKGELGNVYYIYSTRVNLGKVRKEENALWSFAPHDISIILYLLDEEPEEVTAKGGSYLQKGVEDVIFLTLRFPNQVIAHIHVSWLDPHRIRKTTVVGSKKMAVFDDTEIQEKIKIYDRGIERGKPYDTYEELLTLRLGDTYIPRVDLSEPLKIECQHFLDCIKESKKPLTDGEDGLKVLRVLEAAQESLDKGGKPVHV